MGEKAIRIEAGGVRLYAILSDTATAVALWEALPLHGTARLYGQSILVNAPLGVPLEPIARASVKAGDLAFWPDGPAVGLYFGKTPASTGDDPAAASPVNVFGRITGDAGRLVRVAEGAKVKLTPLGD
ncbi:MAG TPA: cyclophilin-like fold protein [Verrucomicrobiae bacterium]|nr:cyclophilin-like fold protein [Verrucomicrobiae bacterium]